MTPMTNPTQIKTGVCRLAFPALFAPKPKFGKDSDLVFQATILVPPDLDLAPFKAAVVACMEEHWGAAQKLAGRSNPIKSCTNINLARAAEDKKPWAGYEDGWHAIRTQSQFIPEVVDQAVRPVFAPPSNATGDELAQLIRAAEKRVYPGVYCRFLIGAYPWNHQGTKGIGFNINAVQLVDDGPRLDGRTQAASAFEVIDTGDDAAPESQADASGDRPDPSDIASLFD